MTKWDVLITIDEGRKVKHVVPQPTKEAAKAKIKRVYKNNSVAFISVSKVTA